MVQVPVGQRLLLVENKLLQLHLHLGAGHSTWEEYQSEEEGRGGKQGAQGTRQEEGSPSARLSQGQEALRGGLLSKHCMTAFY